MNDLVWQAEVLWLCEYSTHILWACEHSFKVYKNVKVG